MGPGSVPPGRGRWDLTAPDGAAGPRRYRPKLVATSAVVSTFGSIADGTCATPSGESSQSSPARSG